MKLAVLDLGTNTFHLLIAKVNPDHSFEILFRNRAVVKLGKGGISENRIADAPFKKGIKTIQHFNEQIKKLGNNKIFAFATSAIRSSTNGGEFVKKVKNETGIEIKIISGDEEAELIYYGVRQCVQMDERPALIMDIGGGSTEFIIANHTTVFWKQSFNIGAARLIDQFHLSDPILNKEMISIQRHLEKVLQPLNAAMDKFPVSKLIGSSGSFDTLAEMTSFRFRKRNMLKAKTSYQFNLVEYDKIHKWLLKSTTQMRMKAKGLIKMRVDMIVASSICTTYVLKKFMLKEMVQSKYALKEGALWKIIQYSIS